MKKLVIFGLSLLFGFGILVGCQNDSKKTSDKVDDKIVLTYSNLLDVKTQNNLKKSLEGELSSDTINRFIDQVNFYHQHIPTDSLVQSGFGKSKKLIPTYDVGAISDKWVEEFPFFPGYNCRLTTFQLLKTSIQTSPTLSADDSLLFIDKEAMIDAPDVYQITNEEEKQFETIFGAVATENTPDIKVHIAKVQDYWKQQGVTFTNQSVSMVSVWFHDQLDQTATKLFIGHVGVLVPQQQGYLFIEKISFEEPYQVLKFNHKQSVYEYLMAKYDTDISESTHPFIMENDHPYGI